MNPIFEELAWSSTRMGPLSLRRRMDPSLGAEVHEVLLGDEYLMSSRFTEGEVQLARLGLAAVDGYGDPGRDDLDVVVGGLGLGYTAVTVLEDDRVRSLTVVEAMPEVVDWHERQLLPDTAGLTRDPRTRLVVGDWFAMAAAGQGFGAGAPGRHDAILVDIDHSPRHVLDPSHVAFYTPEGLADVHTLLRPGGVFALWSDDPPDDDFLATAAEVFDDVQAHVVTFPNPSTREDSANTVYVAR